MALANLIAGGISGVYESAAATSGYTKIDAKIAAIDGLPPESIDQEYLNTKAQAGQTWNPTVTFVGNSAYSAKEADADAQTEKYYAFQGDGYHFRTKEPVPCLVNFVPKARASEGNVAWTMEIMLESKRALVGPTDGSVPTA
jgi:hypothetical protein